MSVNNTVAFTVSITPELAAYVEALVASGGYASRSEVVRAALRSLEREEPRPLVGDGSPSTGSRVRALDSGHGDGPGGARVAGAEAGPEDETAGADPCVRVPELRTHRDAIVRLAAEVGVDDLRVPLDWIEREERARREQDPDAGSDSRERRASMELVVAAHPRRPYPVLADLAEEIKEVVGRNVIIWEDDPPGAPLRFGTMPSLPLASAGGTDEGAREGRDGGSLRGGDRR